MCFSVMAMNELDATTELMRETAIDRLMADFGLTRTEAEDSVSKAQRVKRPGAWVEFPLPSRTGLLAMQYEVE